MSALREATYVKATRERGLALSRLGNTLLVITLILECP